MSIPSDLFYTTDHEWVSVDGNSCKVGITEYAQGELGDIVFVDLPEIGDKVAKGEPFGTIEAVKAAADLNSPVTGTVIAINEELDQAPELINRSPYVDGWIIAVKMSDSSEIDKLMSADIYKETLA